MPKFFVHHVQNINGNFDKGIEIHDTLESAESSFSEWQKVANNESGATFVFCMITNANGDVVKPYRLAWQKADAEVVKE